MNPLRRSYEAKVLVVPLGEGGVATTSKLAELGLEGVQVLTEPDPVAAVTEPMGVRTWQPPTPASTEQVTLSADMVVLVAHDLADVPEQTVREVCSAGRAGGILMAAVLVAAEHWDQPAGASAMITLRQEVDMVVSVRGPRLLAALLDVLRGGARVEDHPNLDEAEDLVGAER